MNHQSSTSNVRRISPDNKSSEKQAGKFVAKGHDARLQKLQYDRLPVVISLITGLSISGIIIGRDRYSITLMDEETKAEETFYKHAIASFGQLVENN